MKTLTTIAATALIFLIIDKPALAQIPDPSTYTPNSTTGLQPFGTYDGVKENINLSNGNLNFHLSLLILPQRAGRSFELGIEADSKTWALHRGDLSPLWHITYWQQDVRVPLIAPNLRLSVPTLQTVGGLDLTQTPSCLLTWIFTSADGSKHFFKDVCGSPDAVRDSSDASFLRLNTTNLNDVVVLMKDGTAVHFSGFVNTTVNGIPLFYYPLQPFDTIVDPNGNVITATKLNRVLTAITDSLGRVIGIDLTNHTISYKDANGLQQQIAFSSMPPLTPGGTITFVHPVQGECNLGQGTTSSGSWNAGTGNTAWTVTLPNGGSGLTYRFDFDAAGEVLRVAYPSGGYTSYDFQAYQTNWIVSAPPPVNCSAVDAREVIAKHECRRADGNCNSQTTPEDTTTYQASGLGGFVNHYMDVFRPDPSGIPNKSHYVFSVGGWPSYAARETDRSIYAGSSTLLRTIHTDYTSQGGSNPTPIFDGSLPIRVTTTLNDVTPNLVSKVQTDYQALPSSFNTKFPCSPGTPPICYIDNPIQICEYNFGSVLLRKTVNSWLTGGSYDLAQLHILDRKLTLAIKNAAGTQIAQTTFEYDNYTQGLTASGATQHLAMSNARGNPTAVSRWLNTTGTSLTTRFQFDDAGNTRKITDPLSHSTTFAHTDVWEESSCAPVSGQAAAYATSVTNALGHTTSTGFKSCFGLNGWVRDPNLQQATYAYDTLGRTLSVSFPDGGQTIWAYNDVAPISITQTVKITGSSNLTTAQLHDGLARPTQTQLTSDPDGTDDTDTTYDTAGRRATISNPHRSATLPTDGVTSFSYDALHRVTKVIPPDGSGTANNVATTYSGNCATVTDQAGKKRKSCSDALGRLIQVFEPNQSSSFVNETDYQYDTLDNLTRVDQKGNDPNSANWRTRTFTYNSLSQLLTAANPESGTITYTYDVDGNLLTKVAPAPNQTGSATVTTTFSYDALHRLTQKSFSDSTPVAKYGYDAVAPSGCTPPTLTITNGVGRRTGMCDAAGAEAWSYDAMGRPLTDKRTTNSVTKTTSYTYNLDGSIATLTYPSGRVITYTFNAAARAVSAIDSVGPINYATAASYAPAGALASLTNGASLVGTFFYNNRLQPCRITVKSSGTAPTSCTDTVNTGNVLDFTYGFNAGTSNNGNVASIANNRNTARSQSFAYDELNRIKTAQTSSITGQYCWGETFSYDIWANLLTIGAVSGYTGCTQENLSVTATTKNQISGDTYDSAGNLITIPSVANYTYDAENLLLTAGGVTYTYDGDGKRLKKSNGKLYWYGMLSDAITETDSTGNNPVEYVFFGGKRIARRDSAGAVSYYFADHLGSSRVVTNSAGTILDDSDFYPFGGERVVSASSGSPYKFTGKERDAESGLDNFGRRYYGSPLGRFSTPDPVMISSRRIVNPQIWNAYSYVGNNPLNFIDPLGEELVKLGQHTDKQIDERTKEINRQLKDKNLTKEQKESLKKQKNTLALEKEGNRVVGSMLAALDKAGMNHGKVRTTHSPRTQGTISQENSPRRK